MISVQVIVENGRLAYMSISLLYIFKHTFLE